MESEQIQLVHRAEGILKDLTNDFQRRYEDIKDTTSKLMQEKEEMEQALELKKSRLQSLATPSNLQDLLQAVKEAKDKVESQKQELALMQQEFVDDQDKLERLTTEHKETRKQALATSEEISRAKDLLGQLMQQSARVNEQGNEASRLAETFAFLERASQTRVVSFDEKRVHLSVTLDEETAPLDIALYLDRGKVTKVISTVDAEPFQVDEEETEQLIKQGRIPSLLLLIRDKYCKQMALQATIKDLTTKYAIDWLPQNSTVSVIIPSRSKEVTMVMIRVNQGDDLALQHVVGPLEDMIRKQWRSDLSLSACLEHLHSLEGASTSE